VFSPCPQLFYGTGLFRTDAADTSFYEVVLIQQNKLLKSKGRCLSAFANELKKLYLYNEMVKDADLHIKIRRQGIMQRIIFNKGKAKKLSALCARGNPKE
jgi:hypothetical protein